LLKERGLPLKLKTVATSINKHEVMAMRRFAEERTGRGFQNGRADIFAKVLIRIAVSPNSM
jgi:hypothetical protein